MEERKHIGFIQRPKLNRFMQFGAVSDIYIAKKVEKKNDTRLCYNKSICVLVHNFGNIRAKFFFMNPWFRPYKMFHLFDLHGTLRTSSLDTHDKSYQKNFDSLKCCKDWHHNGHFYKLSNICWTQCSRNLTQDSRTFSGYATRFIICGQ